MTGMPRFFNTSGPCEPGRHYMLPPLRRLPTVLGLIEQQLYFLLQAPRQAGKSTALRELARALTDSGRYVSVLLSMETGEPFPDRIDAAELSILDQWRDTVRGELPETLQPPPWPQAPEGRQIAAALAEWARAAPRPLVVFLDEIDSLQNETLRSVLRQLRAGYLERPKNFPWSLGLCGMRDIRDYKIASGGSQRLNTASPFNVKDTSLTLRNFTAAEVAELYQQHTDDTGQPFTAEAATRAFALTGGQPWLVNALARQAVTVICPDPAHPVAAEHIDQAKEALNFQITIAIGWCAAIALSVLLIGFLLFPILLSQYRSADS